ncbi:MAG: AMP-binding protein, partial [Chloroflexota bacterium]|nr:AMP-binding protein [Chloroflexota bacterium]
MNDKPWLAHYDKGVPHTVEIPNAPLFHFLEESAHKYPDRACTIFKGAVITFKEMNELTDRMAAALVDMGVKKGDRVGIFMPNTPQFVIAYYGILKAGGAVVATNPLYTAPEIEHQASDAGIEVMFVMTNFYNTIKKAQPRTKIKKLIVTNLKESLPPLMRLLFTLAREKKGGFRIEGGLQEGEVWMQDLLNKYKGAPRPKVEVDPDDTALFQYSGGTTGVSKGAVASHGNVVANTLQLRGWFVNLDEGKEVFLMGIPLFHVYGMVAGMNLGMATGSTLVMVPNVRDLKDVMDNIAKYRCTIFPGVPALYNGINNHPDVKAHKYDLSSIKACISGSAALMRETKEQFETLTGGKVFEGYG